MSSRLNRWIISSCLLCMVAGCLQQRPGARLERRGDEIVVCGQFFHTGAPVVLWMDPGGYDAYRVECRFTPDRMLPTDAGANPTPNRYGSFRRNLPDPTSRAVRANGWSLSQLRECVDLFVLHYDVCGTSRRCFKVLQDNRGLSVHFMLDVDGTIYQTLDVKERAWHAGPWNDRSVGVEMAHMGAYADRATLDRWYTRDSGGKAVFEPPATDGSTGIRTPGYVARPARPMLISGPIQGETLWQYDFTDAQYESLIKLTTALCTVLPRIRTEAPTALGGGIRSDALSATELSGFSGIVGHYHLTTEKADPGPAFDWERLLRGLRKQGIGAAASDVATEPPHTSRIRCSMNSIDARCFSTDTRIGELARG